MRCEVKANSMGYDSHIYRKGEYVDVISSKEVERLLGYDVIIVSPVSIAVVLTPEPKVEKEITESVKTPDTSVIVKKKGAKKK